MRKQKEKTLGSHKAGKVAANGMSSRNKDLCGVGEWILRSKGFEEPTVKHKKPPERLKYSKLNKFLLQCCAKRGLDQSPWAQDTCSTVGIALPRIISLQIHRISASVSDVCCISSPGYSWRVNVSLSLTENTLRESEASDVVNMLLFAGATSSSS